MGARVLVLLAALAAALPALAAPELFPLDELEPGMKGTGYTVFAGDSLSAFPVEILDRVPGQGPFDLVLLRAGGEILERQGVSQGMSGSPVYIDGRWLGAIAYNFSFSREPLALLTPAAEMLALAEAHAAERADAGPSLRTLPFLGGDAAESRPAAAFPSAPGGAPLALSVGGLGPAALVQLGDTWRSEGVELLPMGVAASAGGAGPGGDLRPGDALAVLLVDGPVSVAAIGTLSHREGDRVWAFGHPVLDQGALELPLAGARVHGVMASLNNSYKLASVTGTVGTLLRDGRAGAYGILGPAPALLPLRVDFVGGESADFGLARHPRLVGALGRLALQGWLQGRLALTDRGAVGLRVELHLPAGASSGSPVVLRERFAGEDPVQAPALWLQSVLDVLARNPEGQVPIDSVAVSVAWVDEERPIDLVGLGVDRAVLRPGEAWTLRAELRSGEHRFTRRFDVPAAAAAGDLPPGDYGLHLGDGGSFLAWDAARRPERYRFHDHGQLLRLLARLEPSDRWLVWISAAGETEVIGEVELSLPAYFRELRPSVSEGKPNPDQRHLVGVVAREDAGGKARGLGSLPVTVLSHRTRSAP